MRMMNTAVEILIQKSILTHKVHLCTDAGHLIKPWARLTLHSHERYSLEDFFLAGGADGSVVCIFDPYSGLHINMLAHFATSHHNLWLMFVYLFHCNSHLEWSHKYHSRVPISPWLSTGIHKVRIKLISLSSLLQPLGHLKSSMFNLIYGTMPCT